MLGALALLVGGLLIGATVTELTLRLFDMGPGDAVAFATQPAFERIAGVYHPDQDLVDRSLPELPYHVRINNVGYRGPDISPAKPEGQMRILLVGDSFGFGANVDEEGTIAAHLERIMRQRCGDVIVMNASVSGSTITEHRPLFLRGLALDPDIAVLEVTGNDVEDMMVDPPRWKQLAADRAARDFGPLSYTYPVLRKLRLWRVMRAGIAGVRARRLAMRPAAARSMRPDSTIQRLRTAYVAELRELIDTLHAEGIPFTIALYPRITRLRTGASAVSFLKTTLARDSRVRMVDVRQSLLASGLPDSALYLLPHDTHPTSRAHEIAARQIAANLACPAARANERGTR